METKGIVAIFDFDKTLTKKDTLMGFLRFNFGYAHLVLGFFILVPYFVGFILGLVSRQRTKEQYLYYFLKNLDAIQFKKKCIEYASEIEKIANPLALEKLRWHQENGHFIIIVSASIEDWILPWAETKGVNKVIATKVMIKESRISRKFLSRNCYGKEKVTRFFNECAELKDAELYVYGDSKGDYELLSIASKKFYRSFW